MYTWVPVTNIHCPHVGMAGDHKFTKWPTDCEICWLLHSDRRLLSVEHIDEQDKPILYLVFEYLDTDLKKYMDTVIPRNERMPLSTVKVGDLLGTGHFWYMHGTMLDGMHGAI